jgi:hypothetical protein
MQLSNNMKEKVTFYYSNMDVILSLNYAISNSSKKNVTFYYSNMDVISSLNSDRYSDKTRFANIPDTPITCKWKKMCKKKSLTSDQLIEEYGTPDLLKSSKIKSTFNIDFNVVNVLGLWLFQNFGFFLRQASKGSVLALFYCKKNLKSIPYSDFT